MTNLTQAEVFELRGLIRASAKKLKPVLDNYNAKHKMHISYASFYNWVQGKSTGKVANRYQIFEAIAKQEFGFVRSAEKNLAKHEKIS